MHIESVEDGRENSFGYSKETERSNNETLFQLQKWFNSTAYGTIPIFATLIMTSSGTKYIVPKVKYIMSVINVPPG